jgi:uncharacterized membrane protein
VTTAAHDRAHAADQTTSTPPKLPGLLMGIGLGGFLDGILAHQILQWHHMLTDTGEHPANTVTGLQDNTLADGLFHLATWVCVAAAMVLAVRAWQRHQLAPPWRAQVGMLLVGWGVFNLVEGLINHQILGIHHVRDDLGAPLAWDLAFSPSARCSSSQERHSRAPATRSPSSTTPSRAALPNR